MTLCCVAALTAAAQRLPERVETPALEWLWPLRSDWYPERPDTVSVFVVGDIMSHGKVMKSAEQFGYKSFFKYVEDRIQGADLAVSNMEFPLAGKPYSGYPVFSGPESFPQYLSDVGFDIFLLANNHVLDKETAGLRRTIDVMEQRGWTYTGVAADERSDTLLNPLMVHVRGMRIAIVNFTYGTNSGGGAVWPKVHYMRKESLLPIMKKAREADIVLVFPHWGVEYMLRHDAQQEDMARWLVEHGADAIIGAHPHVIQDVQYIGSVPVIYSLGNALSNQNDLPARLELAVTLRFVRDEEGKPRLLEPSYEYLWCTKPGMVEDAYSAVPVTLPDSLWRQKEDYETMQSTYRIIHEKNPIAGSGRPR